VHTERDPRVNAIPDIHGHAKGEHKPYSEERPLPLTARMLFLWFYHACRRGYPRFMMVTDHMNYLTFEDPAAVNLVRRALKLAQAGDLYGAAETANVEVGHAQVVSEGLRRGMRYSIGAEVDNDPRCRPDAQNIVDAMRPDGMVRSVHFITIEHPVHGPNWNWPFDNPEFTSLFDHVGTEKTWELYMTVLIDAIERLPGQIVGHFYAPATFGHWPADATLEQYEDRMLAAVAARGNMAVEFNTRFLYRESTSAAERAKYLAANTRLLRKAKERGIGIAIGSDAHSPRDQGGEFATVLGVLDQLEINEIVFPIAGRLLRVALRVIKPPEPVPEPEPAGAGKRPRKARPEAAPTRPAEPVRIATGRDRKPRSEAAQPPPARAGAPETRPRLARPAAPPVAAKKRPTPPPAAKAPAGKPPSIAKSAPAKKAPAKAAPAKATPAKKAPPPKKGAPVKAAPVKAVPKKAAPVKKTAAPARKSAPKKAAPAKKAPAKKPVAKSASGKKPVAAGKRPAARTPARTPARPAARPPVKKAAPVRKPAKKAPAKKAAPKRR